MRTRRFFMLVFVTLLGLSAVAQTQAGQAQYILTTHPASLDSLDQRHGLDLQSTVWHNSNYSYAVYLVTDPSARDFSTLSSELSSDSETLGFEPNQVIQLPELSGTTSAVLAQSTEGILDSLPGRTLVTFNGVAVPSNYVQQPATTIIRWSEALLRSRWTGDGIVAVIDTGVDLTHPALASVLLPGFDFPRTQAGASEMLALP